MNRNISILIVVLAILVIVGYLWWLRTTFTVGTGNIPTPSKSPILSDTPTVTPMPTAVASPSATPKVSPTKPATPSATKKP